MTQTKLMPVEPTDKFIYELAKLWGYTFNEAYSTYKQIIYAFPDEDNEIQQLRAKVDELQKDAERLAWLHTHNKDSDGWEWGVARVRFNENFSIKDVMWGVSNHSDIDEAMNKNGA